MTEPSVSIIIPTYQEKDYIGPCLDSLLGNDFDLNGTDSEILIVDGMSTDGTREIVARYQDEHRCIKLLDNPDVIQVRGLNIALKKAEGDVIIRCDAHSHFPQNYISELVKWHGRDVAENIGGVWITEPSADTVEAAAIAAVMSHPLGVGVTYRTITGDTEKYVDTVPFGSWKRETLERIGYFDEVFIRGQDYEHNFRIRVEGGKILLLPWLRITYYARETISKSAKMFYQYGYWKNVLNRKYQTISTTRQLLPPLFTFAYLLLLLLSFFSMFFVVLFVIYNLIYFIPVMAVSVHAAFRRPKGLLRRLRFMVLMPVCFFITHVSYGTGYLSSIIDIFLLKKNDFRDSLKRSTR